MNMPGFTAEASLYKIRRFYRSASLSHDFPGDEGMQPARLIRDTSYQRCRYRCFQDTLGCWALCPDASTDEGDLCLDRCNRGHRLCVYSCDVGAAGGWIP